MHADSKSHDANSIALADALVMLAAELEGIDDARQLLVERAEIGDLSAVAGRAYGPLDGHEIDASDWPIPPGLWRRLGDHSDAEWRRGDITASPQTGLYTELDEASDRPLRLLNVRFDREEVRRVAQWLPVDWVSAHGAIALLLPTFSFATIAARALCKRARHGLVKTRARLFKWQADTSGNFYGTKKVERQAEFAPLPETFWWAEGGDALKQDWISGDFSTWIDSEYHLRAFGVEFARRNVESMLPGPNPIAAGPRPPAAHDPQQAMQASAALPTGDPGRPSKGSQLYFVEFKRRLDEGLCADSLQAEATALLTWFKLEHPIADPPTTKTISNRIRDIYNARKFRP